MIFRLNLVLVLPFGKSLLALYELFWGNADADTKFYEFFPVTAPSFPFNVFSLNKPRCKANT